MKRITFKIDNKIEAGTMVVQDQEVPVVQRVCRAISGGKVLSCEIAEFAPPAATLSKNHELPNPRTKTVRRD